jgi:ferredoxin like protein
VSADTGDDAAPRALTRGSREPAALPEPLARESWLDVPFADRMATVEFRVSERAHIVVDADRCDGCSTQACVTACPANLFVPTADGRITFNYEQCFECGTCYLACNTEGAISWGYPDGGFGVVLRRS